ncbi:MAG: NAD(+) kinase, partial [Nitrospirota bacterium]|nr:NAD(+) kinase [Nitrospirota bacterium]
MKKIGIIAKDIAKARAALVRLNRWLASRGKEVLIDERSAGVVGLPGMPERDLAGLADMIIVLGGDGTLLSA